MNTCPHCGQDLPVRRASGFGPPPPWPGEAPLSIPVVWDLGEQYKDFIFIVNTKTKAVRDAIRKGFPELARWIVDPLPGEVVDS